jgi:hypothetical protein
VSILVVLISFCVVSNNVDFIVSHLVEVDEPFSDTEAIELLVVNGTKVTFEDSSVGGVSVVVFFVVDCFVCVPILVVLISFSIASNNVDFVVSHLLEVDEPFSDTDAIELLVVDGTKVTFEDSSVGGVSVVVFFVVDCFVCVSKLVVLIRFCVVANNVDFVVSNLVKVDESFSETDVFKFSVVVFNSVDSVFDDGYFVILMVVDSVVLITVDDIELVVYSTITVLSDSPLEDWFIWKVDVAEKLEVDWYVTFTVVLGLVGSSVVTSYVVSVCLSVTLPLVDAVDDLLSGRGVPTNTY